MYEMKIVELGRERFKHRTDYAGSRLSLLSFLRT